MPANPDRNADAVRLLGYQGRRPLAGVAAAVAFARRAPAEVSSGVLGTSR